MKGLEIEWTKRWRNSPVGGSLASEPATRLLYTDCRVACRLRINIYISLNRATVYTAAYSRSLDSSALWTAWGYGLSALSESE